MPVSWKQLVKILKDFGFEGPFSGGRPPFMITNDLVLTIPNSHNKEISVDLLSRILKQADIKKTGMAEKTMSAT